MLDSAWAILFFCIAAGSELCGRPDVGFTARIFLYIFIGIIVGKALKRHIPEMIKTLRTARAARQS